MNINEIIKVISKSYIPLTDDCIEELNLCSKVFKLDKGFQLVKEGEYADKVYYIALGSARAYYLKEQKDISDWFAFENEFISSINSFFLNVPSPHFIETLEPSIVLEFDREDVNRLSDKYIEFDRLGKMAVTNTMLKLQRRIVSMQFETAQQKYENLLVDRPDITQRIPLTHIASYLGITLETLSRIRNPKNRI